MTRKATPENILDAILTTTAEPSAALIRSQLKYDYSEIDPDQRLEVQDAAVEIKRSERRAQESMIAVGKRLIGVKDILPHGQFQEWCRIEFGMSISTIENMINVAKVFGAQNPNTVGILSDSAMYLLAAPSTPEPARIAVIEQAQAAGKSPTKAQVKAVIAEHKPDTPRNNLGDALTEELLWLYWHKSVLPKLADSTVEECRRRIVESGRGAAVGTWRYETYHGRVRAWHESLGGDHFHREPDAIITYDRFAKMTVDLAQRVAAQTPSQPTPSPEQRQYESAARSAFAPSTLPADLASRGWELRRVGGVGKWYCNNPAGHRATGVHERSEDAIQAAYGLQRDLAWEAAQDADPAPPSGEAAAFAAARSNLITAITSMQAAAFNLDGHADELAVEIGTLVEDVRRMVGELQEAVSA